MIQYASYSDMGGRPYNEDTVRIKYLEPDRLCAVLADGLGGHGGGKTASSIAADVISGGWEGTATPESLSELIQAAHQKILDAQTAVCRMKTTVVVLSVEGNRFDWAHAGDSRLYHFHNGALICQTRDHSISQVAALMGQITADQIRFHEDRSHIFRALGQESGLSAETHTETADQGTHAFLLCSDGFWEYVYENEMEEDLRRSGSPQEWLTQMRLHLDQRCGTDNDNNSAIAVWITI